MEPETGQLGRTAEHAPCLLSLPSPRVSRPRTPLPTQKRQEAINDLKKTQAAKRHADDDEEILAVLNKREEEQKARVQDFTTSSARVAGIRAAIMRKEEVLLRSKEKTEQLQAQLEQEENREQNILKEINDLKSEKINLLTNPTDREGDNLMGQHPVGPPSASHSAPTGQQQLPQGNHMDSNFAMLFDQIKAQNLQIQQIQQFIFQGAQQAGTMPPVTPPRQGAAPHGHSPQHGAHPLPGHLAATPQPGPVVTPLGDNKDFNSVTNKGKNNKTGPKPFSRPKHSHFKTEKRLATRPSDAGDDKDKENLVISDDEDCQPGSEGQGTSSEKDPTSETLGQVPCSP